MMISASYFYPMIFVLVLEYYFAWSVIAFLIFFGSSIYRSTEKELTKFRIIRILLVALIQSIFAPAIFGMLMCVFLGALEGFLFCVKVTSAVLFPQAPAPQAIPAIPKITL